MIERHLRPPVDGAPIERAALLPWIVLAVLFGARAAGAFAYQGGGSVMPIIMQAVQVDHLHAGLLVGAFLAPGVVMALPFGAVARRAGEIRMLVAGLALMAAGVVATAGADSFGELLVARVLSGIGTVAVMVLVSKLLADWFSGPALMLPMSMLVSAWPFGIGMALRVLPEVGVARGWQAAVLASCVPATVVLVAVWTMRGVLHRHRPVTKTTASPRAGPTERARFAALCVAFGLFGGLWAVVFGFGPGAMLSRGLDLDEAGRWIAWVSWCALPMAIGGGWLAARRVRWAPMMIVGAFATSAALLLALPWIERPLPVLLVVGLVGFLPGGLLTEQATRLLRPERRGVGFGVFWTVYFIGVAVLPPLAGAWREASGTADSPLQFAGVAALAAAIFAAFGARR